MTIPEYPITREEMYLDVIARGGGGGEAVSGTSVAVDKAMVIWNNTNRGQRKKLLKNEDIAALLARYNITKEED